MEKLECANKFKLVLIGVNFDFKVLSKLCIWNVNFYFKKLYSIQIKLQIKRIRFFSGWNRGFIELSEYSECDKSPENELASILNLVCFLWLGAVW